MHFSFILCRRLKKDVFYLRAEEEGLKLPQIHLLINNRVSEYELRCALRNNLSVTFSHNALNGNFLSVSMGSDVCEY